MAARVWYFSQVSELVEYWLFGRRRLETAVEGLSDAQAEWRMHDSAHSVIEIVYHLAGAEQYWWKRMKPAPDSDPHFDPKLESAVFDGFLRDGACPFGGEENSLKQCLNVYQRTGGLIRPILELPTREQLEMRLISPFGDDVSGKEGLIRLCSHAPYHCGQIWAMRLHPQFPKN